MNKHKPQDNSPSSDETGATDDAAIGRAFQTSIVLICLIVAGVGGAIWWANKAPPPLEEKKTVLEKPKTREKLKLDIPSVPFTDITEAAGLASFQHYTGAQGEKLLPETMGGGCAFFDFDNDGDADLLFVNGADWPWSKEKSVMPATLRLFRNDGTGKFSDATAEAGLDVSFYGMGPAVGDYDNDGWVDLFVSAVGRDRLFHNEQGKFKDVTDEAGVGGSDEEWGTSCCWFDCDNDGDVDLFVGNYVRWSREIDLAQFFSLDGKGRAFGPPHAFEGTFPYLYRNDGGGKFTDISAEAGLQIRNVNTNVPIAKTMGVAPIDLDYDGLLDLIVANDTVQNLLFHNQGNGRFKEVGALAGIAFDSTGSSRGAMGIDAARFRNDKTIGVLIGNFANEMTALYVAQEPMQFFDAATATGLGPPSRLSLTFGVFFLDVDLDGRLDCLSTNGHLEEEINKVQDKQHYAQPPKLFWNCGAGQPTEFTPMPSERCGEALVQPIVGRGSAYADIDGDGDLDIVIAACGGSPRLLRNDQKLNHHWLRIKLVGKKMNRDGIGVSIDAHVGKRVLSRAVNPTHSYMSQAELAVTFGLGSVEKIDKLVIHWPGAEPQEINVTEIDRTVTIEQP